MKVVKAKKMGICIGIKRAFAMVEDVWRNNGGRPLFVYGDIAHNQHVIDTIREHGFKTIYSASEAPKGSIVVIRAHGISDEERRAFIGIYKMINMYRKDAGNAIGALVKQGAEITMENLCRAYDSRKLYNMDTTVSDDTDIISAQATKYYLNLFEAAGSSVTPLTLRAVNSERAINSRTVENFCESVQDAYDAAAEAEYMDAYMELVRAVADADNDVLRELEQAQQPVNISNIEAMQALMHGGAYGLILDSDTRKVQKFIDSVESEQELDRAFAELDKETSAVEETETGMVEETAKPVDTYESVHEVLLKNKIINLLQSLSSRRDYRIPFMSGDGIGVMRLMLVSDDEDKGKISIHYNDDSFGEVSVEIKVRGDIADIYGMSRYASEAFEQKLNYAAENLKEKFGFEEVRIYNVQSEHPADIYYENAKDDAATSKLYKIAKNFIADCLK